MCRRRSSEQFPHFEGSALSCTGWHPCHLVFSSDGFRSLANSVTLAEFRGAANRPLALLVLLADEVTALLRRIE